MKELKVDLDLVYEIKKPDGTPRKVLDVSVAKKYGWRPKIDLKDGFSKVIKSYLKKYE